ncbi:MAG TPA: DJ-1/PfpI family protein, partial [Ktedonobacteraceae bacterium]
MRIAFVIYNGMTALDLIGGYDPLTRLKTMGFLQDVMWDICTHTSEVHDNAGTVFTPTHVGMPLDNYDMVYIPGGFSSRELSNNRSFIDWIRTAAPSKLKVSVCTGALLLGAAGFLEGKTATTHPAAFEELQPYCARVVDKRVVDEGDVITARGVTSSIDLGLYLCEKFAGYEIKERIRQQMD